MKEGSGTPPIFSERINVLNLVDIYPIKRVYFVLIIHSTGYNRDPIREVVPVPTSQYLTCGLV